MIVVPTNIIRLFTARELARTEHIGFLSAIAHLHLIMLRN